MPTPAGWYPDPERNAPFRYWNGDRWTNRYRDRQPSSAASLIALVVAALIIVGSIGPWIVLGVFHASGIDDGRDGWITLAGAVIALVAAGLHAMRGGSGWAIVILLMGLGICGVAIYDIDDVQSRTATIFDTEISPDVGWGLWLTAIGGGGLAVLGVVLALLSKSPIEPQAAPTPDP